MMAWGMASCQAESSISGPFGFFFGMTKEQVIRLVGQSAVKEITDEGQTIRLTTAPRPHPAFDYYLVVISPDRGLLKIVAVGNTIQTNGYGDDLKSAYNEILDAVA